MVRYCFIIFHGYLWWLLANFIGLIMLFYCSLLINYISNHCKTKFFHILSFISLISFIYVQFSLHLPINSLLCWHRSLISNIVKWMKYARPFYIGRVIHRVHYTYSHLEKILVGNSQFVIWACICLRYTRLGWIFTHLFILSIHTSKK